MKKLFGFFFSIDLISKKEGFIEYIEIEILKNSISFCFFSKIQKPIFVLLNLNGMKRSYLLLLSLIVALATACEKSEKTSENKEKSEVVSETIPGIYGAEVNALEIATTSQMVAEVMEKGTFEGKISGEIKEVCVRKGCWLTIDLPSGESMRVTFKDYDFFVPTTSDGFPIVLEEVATLTETDGETLRHFAEDQGKSKEEVAAITESKREITFEAVGVVIKDKA